MCGPTPRLWNVSLSVPRWSRKGYFWEEWCWNSCELHWVLDNDDWRECQRKFVYIPSWFETCSANIFGSVSSSLSSSLCWIRPQRTPASLCTRPRQCIHSLATFSTSFGKSTPLTLTSFPSTEASAAAKMPRSSGLVIPLSLQLWMELIMRPEGRGHQIKVVSHEDGERNADWLEEWGRKTKSSLKGYGVSALSRTGQPNLTPAGTIMCNMTTLQHPCLWVRLTSSPGMQECRVPEVVASGARMLEIPSDLTSGVGVIWNTWLVSADRGRCLTRDWPKRFKLSRPTSRYTVFTHIPKDPNCEACRRTEVVGAQSSRQSDGCQNRLRTLLKIRRYCVWRSQNSENRRVNRRHRIAMQFWCGTFLQIGSKVLLSKPKPKPYRTRKKKFNDSFLQINNQNQTSEIIHWSSLKFRKIWNGLMMCPPHIDQRHMELLEDPCWSQTRYVCIDDKIVSPWRLVERRCGMLLSCAKHWE